MASIPHSASYLGHMLVVKAMVVGMVMVRCCSVNMLSGVDYSNFQTGSYIFSANFAGVSLNFSQIYSSAINSSVF